MDAQQIKARRGGGRADIPVLRRLLRAFLPHLHILLATFLITGVYSAAMTARVALLWPALRVFAKDITPAEAEAAGLPKNIRVIHTLTDGKAMRGGWLAKTNQALDKLDQRFADLLAGDNQDPKHRAQIGAMGTVIMLFLVVALVAFLTNFAQQYLQALLVIRILVSLRVRLLDNLLQQPLAFYNEQKRGELIARMGSDVGGATICLTTLAGPMIQQPLMLLGPAIVIVAAKWWLGFFLVGYLACVMLSFRKQGRRVNRRARVRQRTISRVTETMVQMFSGIRVVKAFGLESAKVQQYVERNREFARDAMATEVTKAWTRAGMELLTHVLIVLVSAVLLVVIGTGGNLPVALLLLFFAMAVQMFRPSKQLTRAYTELLDNVAGARRVFEFMDLKPGMADRSDAKDLAEVAGRVTFENVGFSYNGNGRVLDKIDLEIPVGKVVALVGHSGAGKSTLVNLVPRFYDPDEGAVLIDGIDVRTVTRESLLRSIGIVTQEPFLFNTTVRENIAYGRPGATMQEIREAARAANIDEFIAGLPRGYQTVVGERGTNISGGQCQRMTIARAILRDPKILILDEATSNLDTESERAVQQALHNLMRGRTTLVIAHRLSTVQHADLICVMQEGHIREQGTHENLMHRDSLYRRLYDLQFAAR